MTMPFWNVNRAPCLLRPVTQCVASSDDLLNVDVVGFIFGEALADSSGVMYSRYCYDTPWYAVFLYLSSTNAKHTSTTALRPRRPLLPPRRAPTRSRAGHPRGRPRPRLRQSRSAQPKSAGPVGTATGARFEQPPVGQSITLLPPYHEAALHH